jgi:hypothetical protein
LHSIKRWKLKEREMTQTLYAYMNKGNFLKDGNYSTITKFRGIKLMCRFFLCGKNQLWADCSIHKLIYVSLMVLTKKNMFLKNKDNAGHRGSICNPS